MIIKMKIITETNIEVSRDFRLFIFPSFNNNYYNESVSQLTISKQNRFKR